MIAFNREELLKIAKLSALQLSDKEIDLFVVQLQKVLDYITQIQQVTTTQDNKNASSLTNVLREDEITPSNSQELLALAPQAEEGFFVVPTILSEKSKDAA